MTTLIALIPAFPLLGFFLIMFFGSSVSKKVVGFIGSGSVAVAAIITIIAGIEFLHSRNNHSITVILWKWMSTGGFSANIALRLDSLSLVFCFVITFVGVLIHVYAVEFMGEEEGFVRFFAFMNLFVFSMLILVLGDNLLVMYSGWEGVGLCSYLLIGFYYKHSSNGYAARKAFIVTRIGDTFMILGLFLLFINLGTLNIQELMHRASLTWVPGSHVAIISTLLLLGGAMGKSAQLPLHTWLPDAMAGPSPVSALIHAATMVTAGVYLIARTHVLFALAPFTSNLVAIIGAVTLLVAGFSALGQHDLKRILAYSTISQIGYMFLALGVGAYSAAIFHFMIHAFFKALLFLSGGAVIYLMNDEHDIFKMGGLYKKMPGVFITFFIGSLSLAALPLVSAGFFSKDQILWYAWSAHGGNKWLWTAGYAGAFTTALYTFRLIFITFFGKMKMEPAKKAGKLMLIPLFVLAILSFIGGYIELPENFGNIHLFSNLVISTLPETVMRHHSGSELIFQLLAALATFGGIFLAWFLFIKKPSLGEKLNHSSLSHFFHDGLGFDKLYDTMIVKPVVWMSFIDKNDIFDLIYKGIAGVTLYINKLISLTQNGNLRWYIMVISLGIISLVTILIFR